MSTVEGLPVIEHAAGAFLRTITLPGANRRLTLRDGAVGFVLAHQALWFDRRVERLDIPGQNESVDEGGWNPRRITGGSGWSKHATGGAMDLNWSRHPYNTPTARTFTAAQIADIQRHLNGRYEGVVEWGGNWPSRPGSTAKTDCMHFQISSRSDIADCEALARKLMRTKLGKEILAANPGLKAAILS